jgi:hypothetical protein
MPAIAASTLQQSQRVPVLPGPPGMAAIFVARSVALSHGLWSEQTTAYRLNAMHRQKNALFVHW